MQLCIIMQATVRTCEHVIDAGRRSF